jgi:hypothetical protein
MIPVCGEALIDIFASSSASGQHPRLIDRGRNALQTCTDREVS